MNVEHDGGGTLCRLAGYSTTWWQSMRPTWDQLLCLEPGLAVVETAVALAGRPLREAEWQCVRGMVENHVGLISRNVVHPLLGSPAAFDAALEHLHRVSEGMRRPPRWRRSRRW